MENLTATQEFQLVKKYHGYSSKNRILLSGTEEACKDELQSWLSTSKRNGADVVEESDTHYTCDNYGNHGETVTFEVTEA